MINPDFKMYTLTPFVTYNRPTLNLEKKVVKVPSTVKIEINKYYVKMYPLKIPKVKSSILMVIQIVSE